ncbi:hypothetical protein N624_2809 [Levilactobacillus brevis]|nr:hypothetical protein N624_2809 [Levilactobacillus brevis]
MLITKYLSEPVAPKQRKNSDAGKFSDVKIKTNNAKRI